jgi:hypothetical protein
MKDSNDNNDPLFELKNTIRRAIELSQRCEKLLDDDAEEKGLKLKQLTMPFLSQQWN